MLEGGKQSPPKGCQPLAACSGTTLGGHAGFTAEHPKGVPSFPSSQGHGWVSQQLTQAAVDARTPGRRELEAVTPHFKGPPIN